MSEGPPQPPAPQDAGTGSSQPSLPPDVPPPLRAAVAAALAWLRELDRAAAAEGPGSGVRRPR